MKKTAKTIILCVVICVSVSSKLANANNNNNNDVFPTHEGDMHMDSPPPPPPPPIMEMAMGPTSGDDGMHSNNNNNNNNGGMMHMTFFWGKNTQILFSGWPGSRSGMYAVALLLVFFMAVAVEWLSHWRLMMEPGQRNVAAGIAQTAVHFIRIGFAYLVMLALMSFNGAVFIVAVAGHSVGFLVFGSRVWNNTKSSPYDQGTAVC